jgi:hypothetical protein
VKAIQRLIIQRMKWRHGEKENGLPQQKASFVCDCLNNDGTNFEIIVFSAPSKAFLEDQKKLAEAHVKARQQKTWVSSHQHTYSTPVPAPAREFREFCNVALSHCILISLQEPPSFQQNNSSSTGSPTDSILRQSTHHYASPNWH